MISYAKDSPCPCGSERKAVDCCIPLVPPAADRANAYSSLNLKLSGADAWGRRMGLPKEWSASVVLNQPHQLDAIIDRTGQNLMEMLFGISTNLEHFLSFAPNWGRLVDSLYAVRYHQRQVLSRMRIILDGLQPKKIKGSPQLQIGFADIPLKHDLEAFLVRTRATLDTAARLASVCLKFKPMSFGKLLKTCGKPASSDKRIPAATRKALKSLYEKNQDWIDPITSLRHSVVHEGAFEELQSVSYTISGVERPSVSGRPADEYCIEAWKSLCSMIEDLIRIVCERSAASPAEAKGK